MSPQLSLGREPGSTARLPYSALLWEGPPKAWGGPQLFPTLPLDWGAGAAHLANSGWGGPAPDQSWGVLSTHISWMVGTKSRPLLPGTGPQTQSPMWQGCLLGGRGHQTGTISPLRPPPSRAWRTAPKVACLPRECGDSVSAQGGPTSSKMAPKDVTHPNLCKWDFIWRVFAGPNKGS